MPAKSNPAHKPAAGSAAPANLPVYALVGSDAFLQLQALARILRQLPADVQRVDADGETAELADVLDELRSFAMFGSGKLVVVRNADAFLTKYRSQLEDYVAAPSSSGTLALRLTSLPANQRIYKAIAKVGAIEQCEPPKDLARWLIERARTEHRATISPDAAAMLADLIGADMGRLDGELAKLALASDDNTIGPDDVSEAVAFQRERQMWDMTNALAAGQTDEAIRRWRQLTQMDSSAEFRAITWLGMWLENVRKAIALLRGGANAFTICQQLRIWPRELQTPFIETAKAMGEAGANRALALLAEIDCQTKTGVGDAKDNVERFMLSLAANKGARG
jgi:DNA polymerase-3 subunit delta